MPNKHRVCGALRTGIEQRGGSMIFERTGYRHGAWIVTLDGKRVEFVSDGNGFRELDRLYVTKPGITKPEHYTDYTEELVSGAIGKLVAMLN